MSSSGLKDNRASKLLTINNPQQIIDPTAHEITKYPHTPIIKATKAPYIENIHLSKFQVRNMPKSTKAKAQ